MLPDHVYDAHVGGQQAVYRLQECGIWKL
eukprot:SAG11_NODE_14843_length_597_cov_22.116466_2_plen_28_part_01